MQPQARLQSLKRQIYRVMFVVSRSNVGGFEAKIIQYCSVIIVLFVHDSCGTTNEPSATKLRARVHFNHAVKF